MKVFFEIVWEHEYGNFVCEPVLLVDADVDLHFKTWEEFMAWWKVADQKPNKYFLYVSVGEE
jgi:hypothetical protein